MTNQEEIMRSLGRLEGQMTNMSDDIKEIKVHAVLTNGRVTFLEKMWEQTKGGAKVINFLWGSLAAGSVILLNYFFTHR